MGEYEFSGHTIISCKSGQRIHSVAHKYFMNFWGKATLDRPTRRWPMDFKLDNTYRDMFFYNDGEIAIKKLYFYKITAEEEREVLRRLSICS
jgi:hypothetical protein